MTAVAAFPLASNLRIETRPRYRTAPEFQEKLDALWTEATLKQPKLFNGKIFVLADCSENHLGIAESEYKLAFALQKFPDLFSSLPVKPLAVTGLLVCRDGLIIGRRGRQVTSEAGLWEPAPAGSLSQSDPQAQLLEELEEELGVPKQEITAVDCKGLVEDRLTKVTDIVFLLSTGLDFQTIETLKNQTDNTEYDALDCIALSQIGTFIDNRRADYIPVLPAMVTVAGLLK